MCFTYPRTQYGDSKIPKLSGTLSDLKMMTIFCKNKGVESKNITIITDIPEICKECHDCNIKYNVFPSSLFVCRELSQFVENTIRDIEDIHYKNDIDIPEVLIYISGHGAKINITTPEKRDEQALILLDNDGTVLKYLTTKDIFNIIFGRNNISPSGEMQIPIYSKYKVRNKIIKDKAVYYKEEILSESSFITIKLSSITNSPNSNSNSPDTVKKPYRSSYLTNRGIPPLSQVLFIIDTCYSGYMTHFPYIYNCSDKKLISTSIHNSYVEHSDMPFCICLSSCNYNEITKSSPTGSFLTKVFFSTLNDINEPINLQHLYYYLIKNDNSCFGNNKLFPVITSTSNDFNLDIPFFSNYIITKPKKIKK